MGDRPPCRASLRTRGIRAGAELDLVLLDHSVALQGVRSGGWARSELESALAGVREAHVAAESELRPWLAERGIALRDDPIAIRDYGDLTTEILQNGLFLVDRRPGVLDRPGVVVWSELDGAAVGRALDAWSARTDLPPRGFAIELRGAGFFDDPTRVAALSESLARGPLWLRAFEWSGAGGERALLHALTALVRANLRAPAHEGSVVRVADDADPRVKRLADRIDQLDLEVFTRLADAFRGNEPLMRRVDDGDRRSLFGAIADSRRIGDAAGEARALDRAVERLGSARRWISAYRRASMDRRPRVTVIPTWQCELRCRYCTIPKQDGRVMPLATLERAIELLLSSEQKDLELHFFGGEPLSEWPIVEHALEWGHARASEEGRRIRFLFTTDGFGLSSDRLRFLGRFPVRFQLSLDGDPETQNAFRPARGGGESYPQSPGGKAREILESGVAHDVIQVVHPRNVTKMADNFRHILGLGYRRIQVNYALGTRWETTAIRGFAAGLMDIGHELRARREAGDPVELVNLNETLLPVRGNLEVTVDYDGSVFGSSAFLYIPKHREAFRLGHLDDACSFHRYVHDAFPMEHLLAHWYRDGMAENNQSVGAVMTSFVRWMRDHSQMA